jgi:ribosomal protein L7/L12
VLSVLRCPNCSAPAQAPRDGHAICQFCGATLVDTTGASQSPASVTTRTELTYTLKLWVGPSNVERVARVLHERVGIEMSAARALLARSPCEVDPGKDWDKDIVRDVEEAGARAGLISHTVTITIPRVAVWLDDVGTNKVAVIVALRANVDLSIAEAKHLVARAPAVVIEAMDEPLALALAAALEAAGARASLR